MKTLRSLLLISLTCMFLNACMNDNSENQDKKNDGITLDQRGAASSDPTSAESSIAPLPYIVNYDDAAGRFEIIENPAADSISPSSEQLALALKNKYPEIDLQVGAKKGDTLEVEINDATYLTQSIGSAGANAFLAEATYAFTSLDSIKIVNFMFEPGDHAMPGLYDRKYFDDFH